MSMRRVSLLLGLLGVCLVALSGCAATGNVTYGDLVQLIEAATCQPGGPGAPPCEPAQFTMHDPNTGESGEVVCPGCLADVQVRDNLVTGRLVDQAQGERYFWTVAPSAAEVEATVSEPVARYFAENYFTQAIRPRGLMLDAEGTLLISDFGAGSNDGTVWEIPRAERAAAHGPGPVRASALVAGLPSIAVDTAFNGQTFTSIVGVSAAIRQGNTLYAIINRLYGADGAPVPELEGEPVATLLKIDLAANLAMSPQAPAGAQPTTVLADLLAFEASTNPDHEGTESNPYDMAMRDGVVYVSDAAANTVVRVDADGGDPAIYAFFPDMPNPLAGTMGPPMMDTVPTGLAFGPDGALYVGYLTGFPFPAGAAGVYRLVDLNGDGDALDADEQSLVVTGLNTVVDVTFDEAGTMYTAEFSLDFNEWGVPGRVCQIIDGACAVVITDHAMGPTSLVVDDGYIYVAQEMAGRVSRYPVP